MRIIATALAAAALGLAATSVQAAEVLSQDTEGHTLTVTDKAGTRTVEIAPKGEIRRICEGCTITMASGQSVQVKWDDIVFLNKGELTIYTP